MTTPLCHALKLRAPMATRYPMPWVKLRRLQQQLKVNRASSDNQLPCWQLNETHRLSSFFTDD